MIMSLSADNSGIQNDFFRGFPRKSVNILVVTGILESKKYARKYLEI